MKDISVGDEMNIFVPQSLESISELTNLASTKNRIMTCQSTKNIICISQDSLLSSYLMTKEDKDLGRDLFFNICMKGDSLNEKTWSSSYILDKLDHIKKIMKDNNKSFPLFCGKSLFSLMLPNTLNYFKKNDVRKDEPTVKIIKGVLLEGAFNKAILGSGHNTLIHVLYKEYGKDIAINFINNCQFIPNEYLLNKGFSIGVGDCINTKLTTLDIENIAYKAFLEAKNLDNTITHDQLKELKICSILDSARDKAQKSVKDSMISDKNNGFVATVTSGSKGEYFNLTQVSSMCGQQLHLGKRIPKTLNNGKRTFPHYDFENLSLKDEFESRGFIQNSFLHGMNPMEFIAHSISGREGCVNTSQNTASSGYIQRKMTKIFEDFNVKYDGTVRGSNNTVYSWAYSDDGFDRHEMSFKNSQVQFCDVTRIADRINNDYELN